MDPATQVYRDAVLYFKANLTSDARKISLVESTIKLQDIRDLLKKTDDENTAYRRWPKLRSRLHGAASVLQYYSKVFDSLAQHHPEYVALAWGAFRLVLTVGAAQPLRSTRLFFEMP